MELTTAQPCPWAELKEIYLDAFPKRERKPYFLLRRSVKQGMTQLIAAADGGALLGFAAVIPYRDMVMVDYLAVSSRIRSNGTGSRILQEICGRFAGRKIVLLIERLDDGAENREQRIARKRFYLKNGFASSGLFVTGVSGDMEVLTYGGAVSPEAYWDLQKYALGSLMFRLSGMAPAAGGDAG